MKENKEEKLQRKRRQQEKRGWENGLSECSRCHGSGSPRNVIDESAQEFEQL